MPYTILHLSAPDRARHSQCALAVMAKAPRPGKVKTRLCPPLTPAQAAALNICFLKDTTENLAQVAARSSAAGLVCYTPVGDEPLFEGLLPESFSLIAQREGDFGERLLGAAEDILDCGFGAVCLIDSDSPTVPAAAFELAVAELNRPGDRIVLGGSDDGGYYLIGLKQAHAEAFRDVAWSTSSVFADTVAAVKAAGIELVELPLWYDVDDGATLDILTAELLDGTRPVFSAGDGYAASHSREFLHSLCAAGSRP
jgi:rSAM/selenodomain-associated transferase 1